MTSILAVLQAMEYMYRHHHWTVHGDAFYGDHLLFERLADSLSEEIDALAEKIVGGGEDFDPLHQMARMGDWVSNWSEISCLFRRSMQMERDLQELLQTFVDDKTQSLGLVDLLTGIANSHETATYLLKQRLFQVMQGDSQKESFDSLERSWSGNSSFAPITGEEESDLEDDVNVEEVGKSPGVFYEFDESSSDVIIRRASDNRRVTSMKSSLPPSEFTKVANNALGSVDWESITDKGHPSRKVALNALNTLKALLED